MAQGHQRLRRTIKYTIIIKFYRYQQQEKCKFLGVVVNREGEECAACADVMNTYFNHGSLPIGLVRNGIKNPSVWINYKALPTYKKSDGTPMFAHSISDYTSSKSI